MDLSDEQRLAVNANLSINLILAGPGSGKTFTIINRLVYMVKKLKIKEENILVITFTKAASVEMMLRFKAINSGCDTKITFGTMHSIFYSIIREKFKSSNIKILNDENKKKIYKTIWKKVAKDKPYIGDEALDKYIKDYNKSFSNKEKIEEKTREIGNSYYIYKKKMNLIDFDDMIILCYKYLKSDTLLLRKYSNKYKHILIDEFQDLSLMQYKIIRLLSNENKSIYAVGDDDQSIYKFRGSDPTIIKNFISDYKDCKVFYLSTNYRCNSNIVMLSNRLIKHNTNRTCKKIISGCSEKGHVYLKQWKNRCNQAKEIADNILELNDKGILFNNIAVISRLKISFYQIITEFNKRNIPYYIKNTPIDLTRRIDVKVYVSLFKMISGEFNRSLLLFILDFFNIYYGSIYIDEKNNLKKIENKIKKYIYKDEIEAFISFLGILNNAKNLTPYLAINYLRKVLDIDNILFKKYSELDIEEYRLIISELEDISYNYYSIIKFVKDVSNNLIINSKTNEGVCLTTIHSSKGLEYDAVLLPDLIEGYFPNDKKNGVDIEEERRLMYVALTRAKKHLYMYTCSRNNIKNFSSSRFLNEIVNNKNK